MISLTPVETAATRKKLDDILRRIVVDGIAPPLIARGFRRKGMVFRKELNERLLWLVDFDHDTWSTKKQKAFSLQFGAFVFGFSDVYHMDKDPNGPKARERISAPGCPLPGLLGHVGGDPNSPWLQFTTDASDEEIMRLADHLRMRIERYILPWIEQFQTLPDIARELMEPVPMRKSDGATFHTIMEKQYRAAAAVYFIAGDYDAALATLDAALAKWTRRRRHAGLVRYSERLRSMIDAARGRPIHRSHA